MELETEAKVDRNGGSLSLDRYVAALKRERAMYVARGEGDRAAEVAAELARVSGRKDPDAEPVERAVAAPPEKRTAAKRSTSSKRARS